MYMAGTEPAEITACVVKIVEGWTPALPAAEAVQELIWNGTDRTQHVKDLRIEDDKLVLRWDEDDGLERFLGPSGRDGMFATPLNGRLESGWTFSAEQGILHTDKLAHGHYWAMRHSEAAGPNVWVAEIQGLRGLERATTHNLSILVRSRENGRTKGFTAHRFAGSYTYYFLRPADRWFLIVHSGSDGVDRNAVYRDVLALQFVLGESFYFDVLHGLDQAGEVVARVGGRQGRIGGQRSRPPQLVVPMYFEKRHWASDLFSAISQTYSKRPELRLYVALSYYLDSFSAFSAEARYLFLHVGLEAFAYWLLKSTTPEEVPLVDKPKWSAWLKNRREEIRGLGLPGREDAVFSKITSIAKRPPSSTVVERAMTSVGLALTPEMLTELEEGRGGIVHVGVMFEERREDMNDYLQRIAIVRTMLAGLLSRVVGYDGALVGWTKKQDRDYDNADPSWWPMPAVAADSELVRFRIEGESSISL